MINTQVSLLSTGAVFLVLFFVLGGVVILDVLPSSRADKVAAVIAWICLAIATVFSLIAIWTPSNV